MSIDGDKPRPARPASTPEVRTPRPGKPASRNAAAPAASAPEAVVETRRGPSIIWLIPLVALAVGGWLAWRTIEERGPTITITFADGADLEAGKTRVKYKAVEIGEVTTVRLREDLTAVDVTAELQPGMTPHLTNGTRFWVVRPRFGAGGVTGLGTLVSGTYIEMEPGTGPAAKQFTGLATPPTVRADTRGRRFVLESETLGSLAAGSPVYFREVPVGQVLGHELVEDNARVLLHVFVEAPFQGLVREGSRFWNVSGVEISVGTDGVSLRTGSLPSLLSGGVAFDSPANADPSPEGARFRLFADRERVAQSSPEEQLSYAMYFDGSVRGLSIGAPVEFRGIKLGTVRDIRMQLESERLEVRIPVLVDIDPARVSAVGDLGTRSAAALLAALVERGLRARLQPASLLTGQLYVDLAIYPDAEPVKLASGDAHPIIPTVPSTLDRLESSASQVLAQLGQLPFEQLFEELVGAAQGANQLFNSRETRTALAELQTTLATYRMLAGNINKQVDPVVSSLEKTSSAARQAFALAAPDSELRYDLNITLKELAGAARSLRLLAQYLERHPEALVVGKGKGNR